MDRRHDMMDEQYVVLWLALRLMNGAPRRVRVAEIEDSCVHWCFSIGRPRSSDTLVRAFRRVKSDGMLGRVKSSRESGKRWEWYEFDRGPLELLSQIGPDWSGIAHGKRSVA